MNITPNTPNYRYVAEKKGAGYRTWALYRDTIMDDGITDRIARGRVSIAQGLDPLQAHVAADLLNGNESLDFDNEGQAVIYTGYMQDPAKPDEGGIMRYVLFDPETADHV